MAARSVQDAGGANHLRKLSMVFCAAPLSNGALIFVATGVLLEGDGMGNGQTPG